MAAQIGADFEQMLENIHTLVKSIEAAGVGSRSTEMDGLRTNTTAGYLDSASAFAAEIERMIGDLAAQTAEFRDALRAVVDAKQESEQNLSSTLSQISQILDDPMLTPTAQLSGASAGSSNSGTTAGSTAQEDDSESGGF